MHGVGQRAGGGSLPPHPPGDPWSVWLQRIDGESRLRLHQKACLRRLAESGRTLAARARTGAAAHVEAELDRLWKRWPGRARPAGRSVAGPPLASARRRLLELRAAGVRNLLGEHAGRLTHAERSACEAELAGILGMAGSGNDSLCLAERRILDMADSLCDRLLRRVLAARRREFAAAPAAPAEYGYGGIEGPRPGPYNNLRNLEEIFAHLDARQPLLSEELKAGYRELMLLRKLFEPWRDAARPT